MMASLFRAEHLHAAAPGFAALTAMWVGMMAAMMTPTAWPWLRAFQQVAAPARGLRRAVSTLSFASGYLTAWTVYAIAAAALQLLLSRSGSLSPDAALSPVLSATVLIAAGAFQFTAWKAACLAHCRNPLTFLLARWRNGPAAGYRLGLSHGWYCVGCCWALMATAFAVGLTNVAWMVALAIIVFAEQVTARAEQLRPALGIALIVAGVGSALAGVDIR
jgi:predicted metal-binding membrane protein